MMCRTDMIDYIKDKLDTASDADVENVYWLIEMEFET